MAKNHPAEKSAASVSEFTCAIEILISSIPRGRVCTYGAIAAAAGSPLAARQVVRVLHARSCVNRLPWQRVIAKGSSASRGRIALEGEGRREQIAALRAEGVALSGAGEIDLERYGWTPRLKESRHGARGGISST